MKDTQALKRQRANWHIGIMRAIFGAMVADTDITTRRGAKAMAHQARVFADACDQIASGKIKMRKP